MVTSLRMTDLLKIMERSQFDTALSSFYRITIDVQPERRYSDPITAKIWCKLPIRCFGCRIQWMWRKLRCIPLPTLQQLTYTWRLRLQPAWEVISPLDEKSAGNHAKS
jgi:hypothetical protein